MATFMIGYDLHEGEYYGDLEKAIKDIDPDSWHCLDSTWLVVSAATASQIRDRLKPHLTNPDEINGDRLLVVKLSGAWACTLSFSKACKDWLKSNLSGS